MAAINKFTASALSATNENTLALANFNIDFSLVKVEAPLEYQGLRSALSPRRVENAEQGPLHRTARRLGALFEQILPPIKTLAEAYGRRASEIAGSDKLPKQVCNSMNAFTRLCSSSPQIVAVHTVNLLQIADAEVGVITRWTFRQPRRF